MILQLKTYHLVIAFLAVPTLAFGDPLCFVPYECLTSSQCAEKLSGNATEEVLFRCRDTTKICCPTGKEANSTAEGGWKNNSTKHHTASDGGINAENPTSNASFCKPNETRETNKKKEAPPETRYKSHKNFRLLPSKCGVASLPNRITEGDEAELGEFPWMALVGTGDRYGNLKWICGGTLISTRYVLTAAHCINQENGSRPVLRLGEHNLENVTDCDQINNFCLDPPQDLYPEEIIVHERWNSTTIKNDIALLRLPREVKESISVSPICLPLDLKQRNASEDVKFDVAGWGKTEWNAQLGSNVLRKATLSGVSNDLCNLCKGKKKERYCPITEKQVCAQGWKSVDVCNGDSGGPLMSFQQKIYQVGITSFKASDYCGADNIPSIFTRVESYLGWILDNIRD